MGKQQAGSTSARRSRTPGTVERHAVRAISLGLMTCPPAVRAAARRVFEMAKAGGTLAATIYDSRLDDPGIETLPVSIVATAPLLRIEIHLVIRGGIRVVLSQHEPLWPTFVRVRSPERTIDVPVTGNGRLVLDDLQRGPKQFLYCSLEPGSLVRTEWLSL